MNKLMIKIIRWYQKGISPNTIPRCRYKPTCSNYALTAYKRFNFFKATFLTVKRILKCNPLFKKKYDPVPNKKKRIPNIRYPLTKLDYKNRKLEPIIKN